MIIQLGLRNAFRHKGRFLLGSFVIGITSLLLVFATAQIVGVKHAMARGMTDSLTGHLSVKPKTAPRDFFDPSTGRRLELIQSDELGPLLAKLSALDVVEGASPRLRFGALVGDGENSTPGIVIAVDPNTEPTVTPDIADLMPALKASSQAALVSDHLMQKTRLRIGDEVLLLTETPSEVFNGRPYDIKGVAVSPRLIDEYMKTVVIVNIATTRRMLYVDDVATDIAIRLKPEYAGERMTEAVARISAALTEREREVLGVYRYNEVVDSIDSVGKIATGMATIQIGTVMFVMLTIVLIITRMGLYERRTEIGTLISLGMSRARLTWMFLIEVVVKVVIGYTGGVLIALFMLYGIERSGGLKAKTSVEQYMNGGKILLPVIDAGNIFIGFCVVLAISLLVTLRSCWKAGAEDAVSLLSTGK